MVMRFHYAGKFKGVESLKAQREPGPSDVKFKEPEYKKFAVIANAGSIVLAIALYLAIIPLISDNWGRNRIGMFIAILTLVPHESLHAICFREDVYMYTNLSKGMLFVHGTEDMSKARFVFMSLLPNIVFGLIPYTLVFINHDLGILGVMGALCIAMGFGDYINVFNALTQMPKGAKTFLSGTSSYWHE